MLFGFDILVNERDSYVSGLILEKDEKQIKKRNFLGQGGIKKAPFFLFI